MRPVERALLIRRLRIVAYQWYTDTPARPTQWVSGICLALASVAGYDREDGPNWYTLAGRAFRMLGMDPYQPFYGEEHGDPGDWTVRPLFCLMLADALEQME